MIIKFLGKSYANGKTTGTNSIKSAIGYVLSNEDSTKTERSKEPEILKGNPAFVEQVAPRVRIVVAPIESTNRGR